MILPLLACTCSSPEELVAPPQTELPDVVWVTLDTTRSDRFGVYGSAAGVTPHFDSLSERGLLFEWMLTHVPATLPSHSSMFTGLDPHGHGVPANGYALGEEIETLAERMASLGYDTIAVVAASVLESAMGLDQGFRIYDDELGEEKKRRFEDTADVVNERVWAALEQRDPARPLFLWVHYFDAHAPYEAPEEWHERFVDPDYTPSWGDRPFATGDTAKYTDLSLQDLAWVRNSYTAEVAWQDHNLGLLVSGLEDRGLLDALVVMADHGDLLGDAPDRRFGHANSVSFPVIRVPALLIAPGLDPLVFERPVRNSDMASTLLGALGFELLGPGLDVLASEEQPPIFVEATKPKILGNKAKKQDLWNNQLKKRAVLYQDSYVVVVPTKEGHVTTWHVEPKMRRQLSGDLLTDEARALLEAWDAEAPPYREPDMSPATRKALEALGYF